MLEQKVSIKLVDNMVIEGIIKDIDLKDGNIIYKVEVTNNNNLKGKEITIRSDEIFYIANTGE